MKCFECAQPAEYKHHVIPASKGGTRTVPLCAKCNAKVHGEHLLKTAQLTRAALEKKRARAEKTGGGIPYGYQVHNGILVQDRAEQKVIRLIQKLHQRGLSLRDVSQELQIRGHKTKTGKQSWNPKTLSKLLQRAERETGNCHASVEA